jgi:hypothetical protein
MPPKPRFWYYLYNTTTPVSDDHAVWRQPLPLSRNFSGKNDAISISHGEYFLAARKFIENNDFDIISQALSRRLQRKVQPADIHKIQIGLEKHGEFYHPARVEAFGGHYKISFVLNVAVSETGIRIIKGEYRNLKKLNDEFSLSFLPQVYGYGEVATAGNRKLPMFLGQWFEGYNEFHISRDPSDNTDKIFVWDDAGSRFFLSTEQQAEVYRQAARILAYYYNVETFEQIFPWHHASGDFVVRIENAVPELKLISVRRYDSLFRDLNPQKNRTQDTELILQALLLFFLSLSIRMRLDRRDGVGEIIWADHRAVAGTLEGFLEGLSLKPQIPLLPDAVDRCFRYYLSVCTKEDVYELSQAMVNEFNPMSPETPIVKQYLDEHVAVLSRTLETFVTSRET